jgi:hypothetical protein
MSEDTQLVAAQALIAWLRSDPAAAQAGVRVHPGLTTRRDKWGGIGLFIRTLSELDALLADHVDANAAPGEACGRWLGVAPEELLFSIPRSLMVEAATESVASSSAASQVLPLARRLAQLLLMNREQQRGGDTKTCQKLYLESLPPAQHMASVLPALWVALGDGTALATIPLAVEGRLASLRHLLGPSPSTLTALEHQLCAMQLAVSSGGAAGPQSFTGDVATAGSNTQLQQEKQDTMTWALGLCWSRAIHLWSGPTLVPLADFVNHAQPPNVMCTAQRGSSSNNNNRWESISE